MKVGGGKTRFSAEKSAASISVKVGQREGAFIFITVKSREAPGTHRASVFSCCLNSSVRVRDLWGGLNECRLRWGWK